MQFQNEIKDNEIIVFAATALYSKDSIFKCLYWYGDKFHTNLSFADSNTYRVSVKPISTMQLSTERVRKLVVESRKRFG
jgi:hypothetical protein